MGGLIFWFQISNRATKKNRYHFEVPSKRTVLTMCYHNCIEISSNTIKAPLPTPPMNYEFFEMITATALCLRYKFVSAVLNTASLVHGQVSGSVTICT